MDIGEYKNIYKSEASHFYYVSMHRLLIKLIKHFNTVKKPLILDAGCGTGMLLTKMSKVGSCWGIDINKEAIKYCRKRKLKKLKEASITKIPFKKNFFDIVTSIDVLYHTGVKNDSKAVSEFHRVLKTKGLLIIKVPAHNWLSGKHDRIVKTRKRYDKEEVRRLLTKSGFSILKLSYGNMFLMPLVIFKRLVLEKVIPGKSSSDVKKEPTLINNLAIFFGNIENSLIQHINLPFGLDIYAVALKK
jgi:SAM-dependent methyltransferase